MTTENLEEDVRIENHLRPQLLEDYIGQAKAKEMLKNNIMNINENAEYLGYYDAAHFSNAFKKSVGMSPMSYIKEIMPKREKQNK